MVGTEKPALVYEKKSDKHQEQLIYRGLIFLYDPISISHEMMLFHAYLWKGYPAN